MDKLAPIILFGYNRPAHTRQTLTALAKNSLAAQSELFVFCDGPKTASDERSSTLVQEIVKGALGFKSLEVESSAQNQGLAKSIITGVNKIISEYGKAIIVEDDLITSPHFLSYMNQALSIYEKSSKVWYISGWSYPGTEGIPNDTFLWRVMNCWGWATWKDRWSYFHRDAQVIAETFQSEDISRFNLDNTINFWEQMRRNLKGELNTWAIFWYAIIFQNQGLCLSPRKSLVTNIGLDGSGENCVVEVQDSKHKLDLDFKPQCTPLAPEETSIAVDLIKKYHRPKTLKSWVKRRFMSL